MFWKRKKEDISQETTPPVEQQNQQPQGEHPPKKKGLFAKLRDRLRATRETITQKTLEIFRLRGKIDAELLEQLEEILIGADVGFETTMDLMKELRNRIRIEKKADSEDYAWLSRTLRELMRAMLEQGNQELQTAPQGPSIYLIIGVNGVGKTTAIGKMASRFKNEGKKVLLVAADTFRAAAIEQLDIWSKRAGVDIVLGKEKADPSSVIYKAMEQTKATQPDVVIIDTAGRLHTKQNLMQELAKMNRVISREFEGAPHENLLVLDASTGQNALQQAKIFMESCGITGLILTKLDGTAKGGVVLALHKRLELPVKFIGVGEGIDDLEVFNPDAFTKAIFPMTEEEDSEETPDEEITPSPVNNEA
jgi:fused signal recognition particle receptor